MSSSSNRQFIHDVFLSFRGEDTRRNFVSHLYASLSNAEINTFLDDENIDKGEWLEPAISRAIAGSQICIIVFSETYAESRWCLSELTKIMECHQVGEVLPIFYHVDPSDVRHQRGAFGQALERHSKTHSGVPLLVSGWKKALTKAANCAGWHSSNYKSEGEMVKDIVDCVWKKLDITFLSITDFPVGLESRVQEVTGLIENQSSKVCIVGMWGMGGSGKTTLAKAIYNKILRKFEHRIFIENIREVCVKYRGNIHLQEQLLSYIRKKVVKVRGIALGKAMIESFLKGKRALIALDDVTKFHQLKALCVNSELIGPGSVIIITTRDVRLLRQLKHYHVYEMKGMDTSESLELFSWHAFREANPREEFIELSGHVVTYCGGLPLALEVLGSYLFERTVEEWKSVLSKLKTIPHGQIQEKLRISFDGLDDYMEKDIFLDICCFFIGKDRSYVTQILNGCGLHADIGIPVLIERSLLKVGNNNKLGMHDLLRDMGREIVREGSPNKPEKRSRLWIHKDVVGVLKKNIVSETVEGLALKLHGTSRLCFNTNAFKEMKRLRLLQLDHVELTGDYGYLSDQLRWVYWRGFPLKYMPHNYNQENLVAIDLKHSNLNQVWKEPQLLERVKILNLSHSKYLKNTPDFSKLPNLEKLILKDCPSLSEVDQSIGDLSNLLLINLKDCKILSNLPRTVYKLKSLKTLILSGCSKIEKLEEAIEQMESLATLIANDTSVKQVPFSLARSKSIGYISLCGYEGLARDVFPSIIQSWMSPTMSPISCIHPFVNVSSSLVSMDVENLNLGDLSSMLSGISKLSRVHVQCCSELQLSQELRRILDVNFPKLETSYASQPQDYSLRSLLIGMGTCHQALDTISKSISQGLTTNASGDFFLPGDHYPYWLTHKGDGNSVLFKVPEVSDRCMKGMILCVYSSIPESMTLLISIFIINYTKCTVQPCKQETVDIEWHEIVSNLGSGDKVEILVAFGHGLIVKTAVYLVYGESIDMKMEPSLEPKENGFLRPIKRIRL